MGAAMTSLCAVVASHGLAFGVGADRSQIRSRPPRPLIIAVGSGEWGDLLALAVAMKR